MTEAEPLRPASPYAISKAEAEAAFWNVLGGASEGVVLRPAPVFGPGAGNLTSALARLARTPLPAPLEGLGTARSLVGVDTLVEAILPALMAPAAAGETFLVADDGPLTPADIVSALREGAGRASRLLPAPRRLVELAAGVLGRRGALAALEQGLVIDNRRIQAVLGWHPAEAGAALRTMAATGRL